MASVVPVYDQPLATVGESHEGVDRYEREGVPGDQGTGRGPLDDSHILCSRVRERHRYSYGQDGEQEKGCFRGEEEEYAPNIRGGPQIPRNLE